MGFHHALSGLNAASKSLDIIGHNIANSGTTGFKSSRAEFSEAVASALGSASGESHGIGVTTAAVTQLFKQGNITPTGNNLDVAINGNGFFVVKQLDGTDAYTRSGNFRVDDEGYLRTINGDSVLGYPVDLETGKILTSAERISMVFPTGKPIAAQQTSQVTVDLNLDARAQNAAGDTTATPPIAPTPRATYGTSFSVYDQQGSSVPVNLYFEKSGPNQWTMFNQLDDLAAVPPVINAPMGFMQMNTLGQPTGMGTVGERSAIVTTPGDASATPPTPATGTATQVVTYNYIDQSETNPNLRNKTLEITRTWSYTYSDPDPAVGHIVSASYQDTYPGTSTVFDAANPVGGTSTGEAQMAFVLPVEVDSSKVNPNKLDPFTVELDLRGVTQFGTGFAVSRLSQDGYASGSLTSINISDDGTIIANYSNGIKRSEGQLALADFRNTQGLAAVGGDKWMKTPESGEEIPGTAKSGTFGSLIAGALEESNVDLTAELVNMMTAQRAYQASAQAIKTQDQVFSTLVNLR